MLLVALVAQMPWAATAAGAAPGAQVVPGIVQVALAGAAAGVFIAFADGVFRVLGGVLLAAAGVVASVLTMRAGLAPNALGAWPWLGFVLAVVGALCGVAVLVLSRGWGRSSRRFVADAGHVRRRDSVSDWDRLTRGDDPTADDGRD